MAKLPVVQKRTANDVLAVDLNLITDAQCGTSGSGGCSGSIEELPGIRRRELALRTSGTKRFQATCLSDLLLTPTVAGRLGRS